jgi:hypothetical protein
MFDNIMKICVSIVAILLTLTAVICFVTLIKELIFGA